MLKAKETNIFWVSSENKIDKSLTRLVDESEFPQRLRNPRDVQSLWRKSFPIHCSRQEHVVYYTPAESDSRMFGGNSNWRGPIWFPINFLIVESLQRFHFSFWRCIDDWISKRKRSTKNLEEVSKISATGFVIFSWKMKTEIEHSTVALRNSIKTHISKITLCSSNISTAIMVVVSALLIKPVGLQQLRSWFSWDFLVDKLKPYQILIRFCFYLIAFFEISFARFFFFWLIKINWFGWIAKIWSWTFSIDLFLKSLFRRIFSSF